MFLKLIFCALGVFHGTAHAQGVDLQGSICGTYQDSKGQPLAEARITAVYLGGHSGGYVTTKTDALGSYCLTGLALGEYSVSAADEDKGYPMLTGLFFADRNPEPQVVLSPASPHGHADGRVLYTAGFLKINLIDAESNKPIRPMQVRLAVRSKPDLRWMTISTDSDRNLLIPPNEDVLLNVEAKGYRTWPDDGTGAMLLNLLPGQRQVLNISLRKEH